MEQDGLKNGGTRIAFTVGLMVFGTTHLADAALHVRGECHYNGSAYQLIYDDYLDTTWLDYVNNSAYWDAQVSWADALVVQFNGTSIADWRLPSAYNKDGSGPSLGYYADSELGHLYTEMQDGFYDINGNWQTGSSFTNVVQSSWYWSGTEHEVYSDYAWSFFGFSASLQHYDLKQGNEFCALAVRLSDTTPVPEPAALLLGCIGLAGLSSCRISGISRL